jgi:BirA family biotin operon repressor/biotin-[acetyl-CoA-carboxylase] ligase
VPVAALPDGYRREHYDTLPSTNTAALAAFIAGDPGKLWVTAAEQTSGRGRRGRHWAGGPDGNLAAPLLLVDPAPPDLAATFAFVAALALHGAVVELAGPSSAERLKLKWPNDLLLDGLKVAGILVEGEVSRRGFAVVIGTGVNCVSHPSLDSPLGATDLASRNLDVDAEALFGRLAIHTADWIALWDRGRGFAQVRGAWLARATGVGSEIRVNLPDRSVEGRFEALDEAGRLILVRSDGGREAISAGDVFLAPAA